MPSTVGMLFDSGDVLMRPLGGRWWPKPGLAAWLADHEAAGDLDAALAAGMEFLVDHHHVPDEAAEIACFARYYEVVLGRLFGSYPQELPSRLGRAALEVPDQEAFPDTGAALGRLRDAGVRLGVVSNAWPSLRRRYAAAGLAGFFDAFVVSAEVGTAKPDPAIYEAALGVLGLEAEAVLFVDDDPVNVAAARLVGMRGVVMDRYAGRGDVADLAAVEALVAGRVESPP